MAGARLVSHLAGRGAPKSGASGWGAGRCKISGGLRFKIDVLGDGSRTLYVELM